MASLSRGLASTAHSSAQGRSVKDSPFPTQLGNGKKPHTTNGYSRAVKTVRTQGHLETLLYPCLLSKMTKWECTSFQSGEPSLDPVYMKRY